MAEKVEFFGDTWVTEEPKSDMCRCKACSSQLVYPTEWEEVGDDGVNNGWEILLRCPNCEECTSSTYSQEQVELFDEALDRGTELLVRSLTHITYENMYDEIQRFTHALEKNAILPEDF